MVACTGLSDCTKYFIALGYVDLRGGCMRCSAFGSAARCWFAYRYHHTDAACYGATGHDREHWSANSEWTGRSGYPSWLTLPACTTSTVTTTTTTTTNTITTTTSVTIPKTTTVTTEAAETTKTIKVRTAEEELAAACAKPEDAKCEYLNAEKCEHKVEYAKLCPKICGKCVVATQPPTVVANTTKLASNMTKTPPTTASVTASTTRTEHVGGQHSTTSGTASGAIVASTNTNDPAPTNSSEQNSDPENDDPFATIIMPLVVVALLCACCIGGFLWWRSRATSNVQGPRPLNHLQLATFNNDAFDSVVDVPARSDTSTRTYKRSEDTRMATPPTPNDNTNDGVAVDAARYGD